MPRVPVILHERLGVWNRQLRPRLAHRPIAWRESRSAADLDRSLAGSVTPIVLIDSGGRLREALEALAFVPLVTPGAIILFQRRADEDLSDTLARELGATHILDAATPPPAVATLVGRWIDLAGRRRESEGWSASAPTEPDPWDALIDDGPDT